MADILRPKKKAKKQDLSTITLGYLHSKGKSMKVKHMKRIRILFDTGCGATLINHSMVERLQQKQEKPCNWNTKAGSFQTSKTCKIKFTLPAFHKHRNISWKAFVDETDTLSSRYDMIIGRDLLEELGINFLFKEHLMEWDNATTPMLDPAVFNTDHIDELEHEILYIHDPTTTEAERIQAILDAKYCKADLEQIVHECKQLNKEEQQKLLALLQKYEVLFDGTVGIWKTDPVDIVLKDPNCTPYHAKAYPVPHSQEQKLREEVDRLCKQGILRKINRSE